MFVCICDVAKCSICQCVLRSHCYYFQFRVRGPRFGEPRSQLITLLLIWQALLTTVLDVDLTITARAADFKFTKQASQHRNNQIVPRAQNAGLQAVAQINMKAVNLRKISKAEVLTVLTTLWSMSRTGGAVKKASSSIILPFRCWWNYV